jgi:hypothetical protein
MDTITFVKPFSIAKGFDRLITDLAVKKTPVRICLDGGLTIEDARLLNVEMNVLAVASFKDRFDYDVYYIPLSSIRAIAVNKDMHDK